MKVYIDPRVLMERLEALNPRTDFTSVKAYLFDLSLEQQSDVHVDLSQGDPQLGVKEYKTKEVRSRPSIPSASRQQVSAAPDDLETEEASVSQEVPTAQEPLSVQARIPLPEHKPRKVVIDSRPVQNGKSALTSREEKLQKRAEMSRLSEKSSKEILAELSGREANREGGQVVNEGSESSGGGGDLELG